MKHTDLVQRVIGMTHLFKAEAQHVKVRIEALVQQRYLRRDDQDRTKYWYVA